MRIINICISDWANFSHTLAKAMCSVGLDAKSFTMNIHKFAYTDSSTVVSIDEMKTEIEKADIINYVHTPQRLLELTCNLIGNKRVNVVYSDSLYRSNPPKFNAMFNKYVENSIIALGEFAELGAKNEVYLVGAIDTDAIGQTFGIHDPLRIAHYPSNPPVKGTSTIISVMDRLTSEGKFQFDHSNKLVSFDEQLKRISECDVYIEMMNPTKDGKPYGSWGITALEAAALGKIVVTNNIHADYYVKHYGDCAFILANTEAELYDQLKILINSPHKDLKRLQECTRDWVVNKHSLKATGNKLKQILV